MARDFEDHCWKDVIDADTLQIYQAYRRQIYVGNNPAVLAIDLYNKAYQGGDRPVAYEEMVVIRGKVDVPGLEPLAMARDRDHLWDGGVQPFDERRRESTRDMLRNQDR